MSVVLKLQHYCALQIAKNIIEKIIDFEDIEEVGDDLKALVYFNLLDFKYKAEHPGGTPFIVACEEGEVEHVKLYIQYFFLNKDYRHMTLKEVINSVGKRSNGVNRTTSSWTALLTASQQGHLDIVKLLYKHGGDLNMPDSGGYTCLMSAAGNRHERVVEFLLANGADITSTTKYGLTALHYAVLNGTIDIIQQILKHPLSPIILNKHDKNGHTPMDKAHHIDNFEYRIKVIELIRSHIIRLEIEKSRQCTNHETHSSFSSTVESTNVI
eukprot:g1015.t1